jgi:TonB-dependent receptor
MSGWLAGNGIAHSQTTEQPSQTTEQSTETTDKDRLEEVVVTGYRRSLEDAAEEKRRNTNFTDSIFAEDIGKFPDVNLAESLQRLPGIQIERDAVGEGSRVNIRGLGSQFTILSMNGAQLQTASDNSVGSINDGRGSSLDLFPTELFRSLTISKTPLASQIEGGVAGNVELRPIRPFDHPGFQVNWQLKGLYQDVADKTSPRAGVFISDTWDGSMGRFGVLAGVAYADKEYRSDTFNTVGFTTFSLGARCPAAQPGCNSLNFAGNSSNPTYGYGGGASIPATVPTGMGFGYTDGAPLTVCGPGNTPGGTSGVGCNQLGYIVMPRLARAEALAGKRERTAGIITTQWQPKDNLLLNLDLIYAGSQNDFSQHDLMIMLRSTNNNVPFDVQANDQNILTHATFANAQLLSENRPFSTEADFFDSTLGLNYELTDRVKLIGSVTYNNSSQDQSANTVLLRTPLGKGYAVTYDLKPGELTPTLSTNFDPSDPNLGWQWDTLRVQPNHRDVTQRDAQFHVDFGDPDFVISTGVQLTDFQRKINNWDVSACATNAVNGKCSATSTQDSAYPGALSVIPNAQLGNYMTAWPYGKLYSNASFNVGLNNGWAVPDYNKMASAINIDYFENQIDPVTHLNTYNPREVNETTKAVYVQVDGARQFLARNVKYNAGVRAFQTDQEVSGIVNDPILGRDIQRFDNDYLKYLPSFNVAVDLTESVVFRLAGGRTMTRPNPGDLAPAFTLSLGGDTLSLGNPALEPYFSKQVDAGVEWYISRQNTLALNLWQKKIDGFTSIYQTAQRFDTLGIDFNSLSQITKDGLTTLGGGDPNAAIVNVAQRKNTPETITLKGVEVTLLQPLDFLLKGFGFAANYTRIDQSSKNAPPVTSGTRQSLGSAVTGLSPNTYNLSVYFERSDFSSRLSYNYRDAFVSFLGPSNNIEGNGVASKSEYLDASVSLGIPGFKKVKVSFEAQNLLNEIQLTTIDGNPDLPFGAYAPGRTFVLGLSGQL